MSLNKRMGDKHEEFLVDNLGGRQTRGSGNKFNNPMDGRHNRYEEKFAFAWDGKSTRGNSIGFTRDMRDKAREQAGAERPMVAFRWYDDDRLRSYEDWLCVPVDDFLEMREAAIESSKLRDELGIACRIVARAMRAGLICGARGFAGEPWAGCWKPNDHEGGHAYSDGSGDW